MSTSGTTTFTITTTKLINLAGKIIGKLGEGETFTDEEYNDCSDLLNMMIKQYSSNNDVSPGLRVWKRHRGLCFLSTKTGQYQLGSVGGTGLSYWTESAMVLASGGTNASGATTINVSTTTPTVIPPNANIDSQTGTLAAKQYIGIQLDDGSMFWTTIVSVGTGTVDITDPLPNSSNDITNVIYAFATIANAPEVIVDVQLRDNLGNDTKVDILPYETWISLPSKQSSDFTGDPIAVYYEPHLVGNSGQGYGLLFTDVGGAQDLSKYLVVSYFDELQDQVNPGDEFDFSKEWYMALLYGLAFHMAPMFNAPWTQNMQAVMAASVTTARRANPKQSTQFFMPGNRGQIPLQWWR